MIAIRVPSAAPQYNEGCGRAAVGDEVGESVGELVGDLVGEDVGELVGDLVVGDLVGEDVGDLVGEGVWQPAVSARRRRCPAVRVWLYQLYPARTYTEPPPQTVALQPPPPPLQ